MMPYDYGFNPNNYSFNEPEIDFKKLGRNCKALAKKISRKVQRKTK